MLLKKNSPTNVREFSTKIDSDYIQVKQINSLENYLNLCQEFIIVLIDYSFNICLIIDL